MRIAKIIITAIVAIMAFSVKSNAQTAENDSTQAVNDTTFRRRITIVDIETNIPIKGVTVRPDRKSPKTTDFMGRVELTERFDSIRFSHVEYTSERLSFFEIKDTMYLFPKHNLMDEVVVMGVGPDLRRAMKTAHDNIMNQPIVQGLSFDFGLLLDKRARRDRRHLKKAKEMLREWNTKPTYEQLKAIEEKGKNDNK